jgi:hypothetical protein
MQDIRDLLTLWSEDLNRCSHIFIRAPGHNQAVFFGGKQPIFCKFDKRIHALSVETKRPTFREVKRIHKLLATVEIEGELLLRLELYSNCVIAVTFACYSQVKKFLFIIFLPFLKLVVFCCMPY